MQEVSFKKIIWMNFKESKLYTWNSVVMVWFLSKECLTPDELEWVSYDREYESIYAWITEKKFKNRFVLKAKLRDISFLVSRNFLIKYYTRLSNTNYGSLKSDLYHQRWLGWILSPSQEVIYISDSLKFLLEDNGYIDYEWRIRIYGIYWGINNELRRKHIWKIYKADILDNDGNIVKTIERELHYPN